MVIPALPVPALPARARPPARRRALPRAQHEELPQPCIAAMSSVRPVEQHSHWPQ
jgi:hypothetical protein